MRGNLFVRYEDEDRPELTDLAHDLISFVRSLTWATALVLSCYYLG